MSFSREIILKGNVVKKYLAQKIKSTRNPVDPIGQRRTAPPPPPPCWWDYRDTEASCRAVTTSPCKYTRVLPSRFCWHLTRLNLVEGSCIDGNYRFLSPWLLSAVCMHSFRLVESIQST
jgi:hypothetical protein